MLPTRQGWDRCAASEARNRAASLPFRAAFEVGDAHHVDFPDGTFDLCRTERVLRYLDSPEGAVGEMRAWHVLVAPYSPLTSTLIRLWSMHRTRPWRVGSRRSWMPPCLMSG